MSVTAMRPSAARAMRFTPGRAAPLCRDARLVPAGQCAHFSGAWRQMPMGTCCTPPTIRCWLSSQAVITTRKISSIELGKSESQPPVPKPTWPNTSRWWKDSLAKALELATKS
ncbi:hypothetical protein D9M69_653950 [compost metagenome]